MRGVRLLVAEDDPGLRSVLERALKRSGYVVDAVADGDRALAYLASYEYDAVVLDWRMPGTPGVDVVRRPRARGSRRGPRAPRRPHADPDAHRPRHDRRPRGRP